MSFELTPEAQARLEQISEALSQQTQPQELFEKIMDAALELTGADRGFLILVKPGVGIDVKVARNVRREQIEHPKFQVSRGIIFETLKTGRTKLVEDAKDDQQLSERRSITALRLASVICVPLKAGRSLMGVLYLDHRLKRSLFGPKHVLLMEAFAEKAAAAIEAAGGGEPPAADP